jgi:hypothetical protein
MNQGYTNCNSLTYLLARRNYDSDGQVTPAPDRELLKIFGGPMAIEKFRTKTEPIPNKRQRQLYAISKTNKRFKIKKVGANFGFNLE